MIDFSYIKEYYISKKIFEVICAFQLFGKIKNHRHIAEKGFVQKFINVSDFAESKAVRFSLHK